MFGLITCLMLSIISIVSVTAAKREDGSIMVELIAANRPRFQVTSETRLTYYASSGQWLPVEDLILTPERTWSVSLEPGTEKLLLTTERGDKITSRRPVRLEPTVASGTIKIFDREYTGELEVRPSANGVRIFNRVVLEDYTAGVLAGESIAGWHQEALKAQAVAIRSYTVSNLGRHAEGDFCDQPHCQRYIGVTNEMSFQQAVADTGGQILTYQGQPVKAVYHASSGGRTENNEDIWMGEPVPYLRTVEDFDQACGKYAWHYPEILTVPDFLSKLGFSGWKECDITPVFSEKTGNVVALSFKKPGSADGESLTRETVRWRLGLFSPRFQIIRFKSSDYIQAMSGFDQKKLQISQSNPKNGLVRVTFQVEADIPGEVVQAPVRLSASDVVCFSGKGYGHGIGLSQWGTQGLALRGENYRAILLHYYGKDTSITNYSPL